jgi:ribosomal protein S18 acetylase RimI-like enzyme
LSGKVEIKFLSNEQFDRVYQTFVDSFTNYFVPFYAPSLSQFKTDLERDTVNLSRSVGAFEEGRLIGFSLNGFGKYSGDPSAYVASTGVLPEYRQKRVAISIFEWMFPVLRDQGCRQMILEVISTNTPAIRLYEKLGFSHSRELVCYQQASTTTAPQVRENSKIEIRPLERLDSLFASFRDAEPSWQNSLNAIELAADRNRIFGAYTQGELVGYVVVSTRNGSISQLAVRTDRRRNGIGSELFRKARRTVPLGTNLRMMNVDASLDDMRGFLRYCGLKPSIAQLEMKKLL